MPKREHRQEQGGEYSLPHIATGVGTNGWRKPCLEQEEKNVRPVELSTPKAYGHRTVR